MFSAVSRGIPSFGDLSYKAPVRLVVTSTLAPNTRVGNVLTANANGALGTIDGVAPAVGDRILVRLQAAGADNGIYTVTALGDGTHPWVMTRATDSNLASQCVQGSTTLALAGDLCALTAWTATAPWTLNVTDPVFVSTGLSLGGASTFVTTSSGGGLFLVLESDTIATQPAVAMLNRGDAAYGLILGFGNGLQMGPGGAAVVDGRLFRSAAGVWQIDDTAGNLTVGLVGKAPIRTVYTAGAIWNKPTGFDHIEVELVGGGGQGGGCALTGAAQASSGAGGGGGGYARKVYSAAQLTGASYTVTVGAGGTTGGAGAAGQNGGASSFAGAGITTLNGPGGTGGGAGAAFGGAGIASNAGAGGAVGTGGDANMPGSDGVPGFVGVGVVGGVGYGGASVLSGMATTTAIPGNGAAGKQYGGGGAGAANSASQGTAKTGGAGARGVVIVTEFYGP